MKVWLSAPIDGQKNYNKKEFEKMEQEIAELGWEPINPLKVVGKDALKLGLSGNSLWLYCLIRDLEKLVECDACYFHHTWRRSTGCQIERLVAEKFEKIIMEQRQVRVGKYILAILERRENEKSA